MILQKIRKLTSIEAGEQQRAGDNGVVISLVQKAPKEIINAIQKDVGINEKFLPRSWYFT